MNTHHDTLEKLRELWRKDADAYLLVKQEFVERKDLFYLTGFPGSTGVFLETREHAFLLVDARYHEVAEFHAVKEVTVIKIPSQKPLLEVLEEVLRRHGIAKLAIEDYAPVSFAFALETKMPNLDIFPVHEFGLSVRMKKRKDEIAHITEAQRITDILFKRILQRVKKKLGTEYELAHFIKDEARKLGADDSSFDPIVASGPHSARPHHTPSHAKRIEKNSPLLLDFGVRYKGYCSDCSRTIWIGKNPTKEFVDAYETVLRAQNAGITASRFKGERPATMIDETARNVIEASRFKGTFVHGLGHGVGLEVHEKPSISSFSADILQGGEIITIEPGIYIPGKFGIRIEDMVVAGSGKLLTHAPKNLVLL